MSSLRHIESAIDCLVATPPYGLSPAEHEHSLLSLLKEELAYACERSAQFRNYVDQWPITFQSATTIADLPYLPVATFKANPPLALVPSEEIKRTLSSSATTNQTPSRVALDAPTARRMTRGVVSILEDFIGSARRPYLIIDIPDNVASRAELSARGAAIQSLGSFATEIETCLVTDEQGDLCLSTERLLDIAERWRESEVLVYGFTHVIWTHLVRPLQERNVTLGMSMVHVLHSGGWKRLQQDAVTKAAFNRAVASVFGCSEARVIDYYGMVESVGVIYPDCEWGNKHVPTFGDVIVRNPLTLSPVRPGEQGLVQVCSVLPTSFPGFLLLTEDMAEVVDYDGCACGRRGTHFRFMQRVPKAEVRGCGNLESERHRYHLESSYT